MKNKLGSLLATALGAALLVYSATRSLDFISLTLPPDKQILAWFGLAALDGGVVAWLLAYLYGSGSSWQRVIAFLMVIIDFLGAVALFTLDTIYNAGQAGLVTALEPETIQTGVLALSLVIAINIGATIAHHMLDPEALRRQAEEEARAEIEEQALDLIRDNSRALASEIAPQIASNWKSATALEYSHRLKKPKLPALSTGALPALTEDDGNDQQTNPTTRRRSTKS
jgi:hypothetical protein